jgi:hypothetical protein
MTLFTIDWSIGRELKGKLGYFCSTISTGPLSLINFGWKFSFEFFEDHRLILKIKIKRPLGSIRINLGLFLFLKLNFKNIQNLSNP